MKPEEFKTLLSAKGFDLTEEQMTQFATYFKLLVEWNEKMNLTAITEESEVYLKHFYDSLTLGMIHDFSQPGLRLCDVGSGAGFPSIPLKILYPTLEIAIVDSLNKRITFLTQLTKELGLEGVKLYHDRAETFGQDKLQRESYDFVTARAVARLNVLTELCLPLVKKQGMFFALKAAKSVEELTEAQKAIGLLGGQVTDEADVTLPITEDTRHIITISKKKETPKKFPRKPGTPNKQPIV